MAINAASLLVKVQAAIAQAPLAATWKHDPNPAASYATSTGKATPNYTDHAVTILTPVPYSKNYVNGDIIRADDTETVICASGLAFTPKQGDRVVFDSPSKTLTVVSVQELKIGTTPVAYVAQLRR
ncbi:MAG: hypothetical protein IT459_19205 [Planctomycetes bacterium]|nr:hypothetical protein [Planctomycetota bacterium]